MNRAKRALILATLTVALAFVVSSLYPVMVLAAQAEKSATPAATQVPAAAPAMKEEAAAAKPMKEKLHSRTGVVEKSDTGLILKGRKASYMLTGKDLSDMVGKKVEVTGVITKGEKGETIEVKKATESKPKTKSPAPAM